MRCLDAAIHMNVLFTQLLNYAFSADLQNFTSLFHIIVPK